MFFSPPPLVVARLAAERAEPGLRNQLDSRRRFAGLLLPLDLGQPAALAIDQVE
jgi:hypothetical protein